jgi:hypothetical protein
MTVLSLELDQLFAQLLPLLVFAVSDVNSKNELEFVQQVFSILSHFVAAMIAQLRINPQSLSYFTSTTH